jgi:hypothetical protein
MHWKRRQPKWPYLVSLVCLFVLTIAAPWSWQHQSAPTREPEQAEPSRLPSLAAPQRPTAPTPSLALSAPALPPLAAPTAPEPSLAGPMVIADDYVAIDEPLSLPADSDDAGIDASDAAVVTSPQDATSDELALRPARRSVLVPNTPAPPLARVGISVESLVKVRDVLTSALLQLQQVELATQPQHPPVPRVLVESENDRLAMVLPHPMQTAPELAPAQTPTPNRPATSGNQALLRIRPTALIEQLQALTPDSPASFWAVEVIDGVEALSAAQTGEVDLQATVAELKLLAERGFSEALTVPDAAAQSAWIRASRSLDRRLPVWSLLADSQFQAGANYHETWASDGAGLRHALHEVALLTAGAAQGAAWRKYLRLDDLADLTSVGASDLVEARRAASREVLIRLTDPWLTAEQRQFLSQPPIIALAQQLRAWAGGEVSIDTLAALIERYEATSSLRDADAIAELRLRMKWSADARLRALAEDLNRHYRNANVRMALSAELMNRMIPPQQPVDAPINSRIAGANVQGRSRTETQINVRLLPDAKVWRFGLEAHGKVSSRTASQTWPARLRNSSQMDYEARKLVMVNRFGLHVYPAEANVEGDTRLLGVESSFQSVPIIGSIVENAAREQHRLSRGKAIVQVKAKVNKEACERMDREADAKMARLNERFREHVLEPLERFSLAFEPVDMNTTEQRATMRLRMAGEQHLAAHTPRPSAPSDSFASFQLHESVFNNAVRGLNLDGKRMTVGELHATLAEKIRRHAQAEPADLPRAAKVEFAAHDAIRVRCHGDRIELILKIVELRHGRDSIRSVGVHAFFRPVVEGMDVKLVRDGTLQFDGAHLRTGPRMVLHGVFGKLLPKDQQVPVLAAAVTADPRVQGMMVTQLVIDDGWVALSVGPATPQRTAWRTREVHAR